MRWQLHPQPVGSVLVEATLAAGGPGAPTQGEMNHTLWFLSAYRQLCREERASTLKPLSRSVAIPADTLHPLSRLSLLNHQVEGSWCGGVGGAQGGH